MADQIVTRQDLVDAHYDAETLGEFINGEENTEVTSRLGRTYWTLATINYLISQGQLKISDLQAAIDIAAAAGAGANGWTADLIVDGAETQKQINDRVKKALILPESFGGDIIAAANYAASIGGALWSSNKIYEVTEEFRIPENLIWYSNNSVIKQTGAATETRTASGIAPQSNVTIYGHLTIDMGNPTTGWGEKCHVRIDSFYNTSAQVKGFYFDTIKLVGGHFNCNGFVMAGGASLVRGKRIECGDSAVIGRVFMAHWGNFNQHYYDSTTQKYQHVANYSPTTHPHNCIIDEIVAGELTCTTSDYSGIVLISAGYDIEVKKIKGNLLDSTISGKGLIFITAGDLAFAYASESEKENGSVGLDFGTVNGKTYALGLGMIEQALYVGKDDFTNVTTQPTAEDYLLHGHISVDQMIVTGKSETGVTFNNAVNGSNGNGSLNINYLKATDFYSAYNVRNYHTNTTINKIHAIDCKVNSVGIIGSGTDRTVLPNSNYIKELILDGYGTTSSSTEYRTALRNVLSKNTHIGKIVVNSVSNAYSVVNTANGIGCDLKVDSISVLDTSFTPTFLINNSNLATDPVCLGSWFDASNKVVTAVSGGTSYKCFGRNKEFYGSSLPQVNAKVGDYLNIQGSTPARYLVLSAGLVGASATYALKSGGTSFAQAETVVGANSTVLLTSARTIGNCPLGTALKAGYSTATGQLFLNVIMTADNTFSVYATNPTSSSISLPAGTMSVWV